MDNKDKVRYSIYMDSKLSEYVESEVKRLGISKSGYFSVLVSNDKMQRDVMSATTGLSELLNQVKEKLDK